MNPIVKLEGHSDDRMLSGLSELFVFTHENLFRKTVAKAETGKIRDLGYETFLKKLTLSKLQTLARS
jgi:hypothetical protein